MARWATLACGNHYVKDFTNEADRYARMEEIAHGVDKHDPRASPASWKVERLMVHREPEPGTRGLRVAVALVTSTTHRFEALSQGHRVTPVASG